MGIGRYNATALTGNVERSLDSYAQASIPDGSRAETLENGKLYVHLFNAVSTAAHNPPGTIRPADYSGPGVWENQSSPFGDVGPTITETVPIEGDIRGGDITASGHTLTISPCSCKDSTGLIPLYTGTSKTVALPSVASTWYYIFQAQLVADSSVEFRAYSSKAGVAADAQVSAHRYITPWITNSATNAASAVLVAGELWFDEYADTTIASGLNPTAWTLLDLDAAGMPVADFTHIIAPPANSANTEYIIYASVAAPGKTAMLMRGDPGAWCSGTDSALTFIPVNGNGVYVKESSSATTSNYALLAARLRR